MEGVQLDLSVLKKISNQKISRTFPESSRGI